MPYCLLLRSHYIKNVKNKIFVNKKYKIALIAANTMFLTLNYYLPAGCQLKNLRRNHIIKSVLSDAQPIKAYKL